MSHNYHIVRTFEKSCKNLKKRHLKQQHINPISWVRPSVRISLSDDKHKWIFNKFGICIDIVEIWFGIAHRKISSTFDRVICPRHDNGGVLQFNIFIFLFYYENICCMHSLKSPHRGESNEDRKNIPELPHLPPDLALELNLNRSNYSCQDVRAIEVQLCSTIIMLETNRYLVIV